MIDPLFSSVALSNRGLNKAANIATAFTILLHQLEEIIPSTSREMSIVRTKLEEASFFAKKSLRDDVGNRAL